MHIKSLIGINPHPTFGGVLNQVIGALVFVVVLALIGAATHLICLSFVLVDKRFERTFETRVREKNEIGWDATLIWEPDLVYALIVGVVDVVFVIIIIALGFIELTAPAQDDLMAYVMGAVTLGKLVSPLMIGTVLFCVIVSARWTVRIVDERGIGQYKNRFGVLTLKKHIAWDEVTSVKGATDHGRLSFVQINDGEKMVGADPLSFGFDVLLKTIDKKVPADLIDSNLINYVQVARDATPSTH